MHESRSPTPDHILFSDPLADDTDSSNCPGQAVAWTPGDPWDTYPFDLHRRDDHEMPWEVLGYTQDESKHFLLIRSVNCTQTLETQQAKVRGVCGPCSHLQTSARFADLSTRMANTDPSPRTSWFYLNRVQTRIILMGIRKKLRISEKKVCTGICVQVNCFFIHF